MARNRNNIHLDLNMDATRDMYSTQKKVADKNMETLTKRARGTIPRLVGKAVAEYYQISASELYPPAQKVKIDKKTGNKTFKEKAGVSKAKGDTLDNLAFTWEGRALTIPRFKMSPSKIPSNPRKNYDITFSYLRGQKTTLTEDDGKEYGDNKRYYFIQNIKGVIQTAYRTDTSGRKIAGIRKTTSVPAMINNSAIENPMMKYINEYMLKELQKIYKK